MVSSSVLSGCIGLVSLFLTQVYSTASEPVAMVDEDGVSLNVSALLFLSVTSEGLAYD